VDKSVKIDPQKLEELIIASAGLDPQRGDRVSVVLTEFASAEQTERRVPQKIPPYAYAILGVVSLVLLGLITFGILRLLRKRKREEEILVPTYPPALSVEEKKKSSYEEFLELVQKEPKKAAIVIRNWLKEG